MVNWWRHVTTTIITLEQPNLTKYSTVTYETVNIGGDHTNIRKRANIMPTNFKCCIAECTNTIENTKNVRPKIDFYAIPYPKSVTFPWKLQKRKAWVSAIRELNKDYYGNSIYKWEPKPNTHVCSSHFVGYTKSENPKDPAYVPTIYSRKEKQSKNLTLLRNFDINKLQTKRIKEEPINERDKKKENVALPADTASIRIKTEPVDNPETNIFLETHNETGCFQTSCNNGSLLQQLTNIFSFTNFLTSEKGITVQETPINIYIIKPKTIVKVEVDVDNEESSSDISCFQDTSLMKEEQELLNLCGVTLKLFQSFLKFLPNTKQTKLTKENKLFIFLVKVKLNITYTTIGEFFGVGQNTVSKIFLTVLKYINGGLKDNICWLNKEVVRDTLPPLIKKIFPNCRAIISYIEIRVGPLRKPRDADKHWKNMNTLKVLLGFTPNGAVCFKSSCYDGNLSFKTIVQKCGLLDLIEPEDIVLTDKSICNTKNPIIEETLKEEFENKNAELINVLQLQETDLLTRFNVSEVNDLLSLQAHVQHCTQRIEMFQILSHIHTEMLEHVDTIIGVCCSLINLLPPLTINN